MKKKYLMLFLIYQIHYLNVNQYLKLFQAKILRLTMGKDFDLQGGKDAFHAAVGVYRFYGKLYFVCLKKSFIV